MSPMNQVMNGKTNGHLDNLFTFCYKSSLTNGMLVFLHSTDLEN